mmetsp:Transcript_77764/g.219901  ORF Transcript_77764/g.219901 Transcript_77764/m.219901 type:complete len:325 (-) Transcript_77764:259-1233(-)
MRLNASMWSRESFPSFTTSKSIGKKWSSQNSSPQSAGSGEPASHPSTSAVIAMAPAQSPAWRQHFRGQFKKTKMCRFDAAGQCHYGSDCGFAHSPEELTYAPDLTKTAICTNWQNGTCPKASSACPFAHGQEELRLTPAFAKSRLSQRTLKGDTAETSPLAHPMETALALLKKSRDQPRVSDQCSTRSGSSSRESVSSTSQESPRMRAHRSSATPAGSAWAHGKAAPTVSNGRQPLLLSSVLPDPALTAQPRREHGDLASGMPALLAPAGVLCQASRADREPATVEVLGYGAVPSAGPAYVPINGGFIKAVTIQACDEPAILVV